MKLGIKVIETSPPACYMPTEHVGTQGQHLCAEAIYGDGQCDCCWQCIYGEMVGVRVNG